MNNQNAFNKGKALLWSILITFGITITIRVFRSFIFDINASTVWVAIAVAAFAYAKHLKITSEKGISWGPFAYSIFIALLSEIGLLVFLYDIQKVKAKRKGMDINGKKGTLFVVLLILLFVPYLLMFSYGFMNGYKIALMK